MNKQVIIIGMTLVLLSVALSGCNERTRVSSEENRFVGTWENQQGECIAFFSDGTYTANAFYTIIQGIWEIENGELTQNMGFVLVSEYSFTDNGDTLTLAYLTGDTGSVEVLKKLSSDPTDFPDDDWDDLWDDEETPVSEGKINFSISEVIITNELEVEEYWTNETKIEISNSSTFVIISLSLS